MSIIRNLLVGLFLGGVLTTSVFATPDIAIERSEKIMDDFCRSWETKGLIATTRGGSRMDTIQKLTLHFICRQALDLRGARELYLHGALDLIERVNSDTLLRPYLSSYPFNQRNIDVMIAFQDHHGNRQTDNKIALIMLVNGRIHFEVMRRSAESNELQFETLHSETFDEAMATAGLD